MFDVKEIGKSHADFWSSYPGLLYGLSLYLAAYSALRKESFWSILFFILIIAPSFLQRRIALKPIILKFFLAFLLMVTFTFYLNYTYIFPDKNLKLATGIAQFTIDTIEPSKNSFRRFLIYRGKLHYFTSDATKGLIAQNIPISIHIPEDSLTPPPTASFLYEWHCCLKQSKGQFRLTCHQSKDWTPLKKIWSLAEWRKNGKTALAQRVRSYIATPYVASFLNGLATGEFSHRMLSASLSHLGLQHLMAISGLHFSILAGFLGAFLRMFFSPKRCCLILIILISLYFIFLGPSPSIIRAWVSIILALTGILIERPSLALNSLGIGLGIVTLWNPNGIDSIGFQFSFLVTGAILLFFSPLERLFQMILKKRKLSQLIPMTKIAQHGYCLLSLFRQAMALSVAVNLIALPLTLHYFEQFSILGLIYNFFFPFLISLSMLFLLLGLVSEWIPILAAAFHSINEVYTTFILNYVFCFHPSLDVFLNYSLSSHFLIPYLLFLLFIGIILKSRFSLASE